MKFIDESTFEMLRTAIRASRVSHRLYLLFSQAGKGRILPAVLLSVGLSGYLLTQTVKNDDLKVAIASDKVVSPPDIGKKTIHSTELARHNTKESCWVAIKGEVYDLTDFVPNHPGGPDVILKYAGKDVTAIFEPIHPKDAIASNIPPSKHLGEVHGSPEIAKPDDDEDELQRQERIKNKPPLGHVINLHDLEKVAKNVLPKNLWAYFSAGADDEISMRENHYAYQRIYFRPRVLVNVREVDTSTTMLGCKSSAPFYVSATALAKLANPDGEAALARAAGKEDIIQMILTLASCSLDEVKEAALPEQPQWFQLYINQDRQKTFDLVKKAEKLGMKGLFVTVDAACLGNREKDKRTRYLADTSLDLGENLDRSQGALRALSTFIDSAVTWDDIAEIRKRTSLPVVIKGIQHVDDVIKAAESGCKGVVLLNHGGRQLDFAPAPIQLLAETMPVLKERGLDKNLEVFIDGGVRRGSDILKALCLGAKGVGVGRPFLYGLGAYGENGARKAMQILKDELEMDMRLLGVTSLDQLNEDYVDTRFLLGRNARDLLYDRLYTPVDLVRFRNDD